MYEILADPRFPLLSSFTDEDRRACLPSIGQAIQLANVARKQGVLALEKIADDLPDEEFFIKTGLMLIVDGIDPELVRSILQGYIMSSCGFGETFNGAGYLKRIVEMEAMLGIQMGVNPRILVEKMFSLLGEAFHSEAQSYCETVLTSENEQFTESYADMQDLPSGEGDPWLVKVLSSVSNHDIQVIMKEVPQHTMSLALCGLPAVVQERVFNNMSRKITSMLKFSMHIYPGLEIDIKKAQLEIIGIVKRMQDMGEIIFGDISEEGIE